MPTPFYHLSIAVDTYASPHLTARVRSRLSAAWPAFLLGSTAPDVQTISGKPRAATHFFEVPGSEADTPPWQVMFKKFPELSDPASLTASQSGFIAGYCAHLLADWMWIHWIYRPIFGPGNTWAGGKHRHYLHNVLRTYLDRQIEPYLRTTAYPAFLQADPELPNPLIAAGELKGWHAFLTDQLAPGARSQTIDVFARRQGISPENYHNLLSSETAMREQVFNRVDPCVLTQYHDRLVAETVSVLETYFSGSGSVPDEVWHLPVLQECV